MSRHLALEVEHAFNAGPLRAPAPVPGCGCVRCLTLAAGGGEADILEAEQAVQVLAGVPPAERAPMARQWKEERERLGRSLNLPGPGVLAALAALVPGAVPPPRPRPRTGRKTVRRPLDVAGARGADILATAVRLGLGVAKKAGDEYLVRCPFHDDSRPSLRLDPRRGLFYCDPCARGGDVIELVRRVRGVPFADAVRELAAA